MPSSPKDFHHDFSEKFFELYPLYEEVKKIVLLAEYENKEQKYVISSVNELRNMLDHIMRSIDKPESLNANFDKAKGHLYRAGYDGYEIVVVSKLSEIKQLKEEFLHEAIIEAYPKYYNDVIPAIQKAKKELIDARAYKKIDNGENDAAAEEAHFVQFESIATGLMQIVDDLALHMEGIREAHNNIIEKKRIQDEKELANQQDIARKNRKNNIIMGIVAPLLIGLILLYLGNRFFNPSTKSQDSVKPKIEETSPKSF